MGQEHTRFLPWQNDDFLPGDDVTFRSGLSKSRPDRRGNFKLHVVDGKNSRVSTIDSVVSLSDLRLINNQSAKDRRWIYKMILTYANACTQANRQPIGRLVSVLTDALASASLPARLNLSNQSVQDEDCEPLAVFFEGEHRWFQAYDLSHNKIGLYGGAALGQALCRSKHRPRELILRGNPLSQDGVFDIAAVLEFDSDLISLDVSDTQIGAAGVLEIVEKLVLNPANNLEVLRVDRNGASEEEIKQLVTLARTGKKILQTVEIYPPHGSFESPGPEVQKAIQEAAEKDCVEHLQEVSVSGGDDGSSSAGQDAPPKTGTQYDKFVHAEFYDVEFLLSLITTSENLNNLGEYTPKFSNSVLLKAQETLISDGHQMNSRFIEYIYMILMARATNKKQRSWLNSRGWDMYYKLQHQLQSNRALKAKQETLKVAASVAPEPLESEEGPASPGKAAKGKKRWSVMGVVKKSLRRGSSTNPSSKALNAESSEENSSDDEFNEDDDTGDLRPAQRAVRNQGRPSASPANPNPRHVSRRPPPVSTQQLPAEFDESRRHSAGSAAAVAASPAVSLHALRERLAKATKTWGALKYRLVSPRDAPNLRDNVCNLYQAVVSITDELRGLAQKSGNAKRVTEAAEESATTPPMSPLMMGDLDAEMHRAQIFLIDSEVAAAVLLAEQMMDCISTLETKRLEAVLEHLMSMFPTVDESLLKEIVVKTDGHIQDAISQILASDAVKLEEDEQVDDDDEDEDESLQRPSGHRSAERHRHRHRPQSSPRRATDGERHPRQPRAPQQQQEQQQRRAAPVAVYCLGCGTAELTAEEVHRLGPCGHSLCPQCYENYLASCPVDDDGRQQIPCLFCDDAPPPASTES